MSEQERDTTDTLSAPLSMTFTWREWALIYQGCLRGEQSAKHTNAERDEFRRLATLIDSALTDCDAFGVWQADQWVKS